MMSYREAATTLWGPAGTYAHDAYTRLRSQHFPELPEQVPIVIGLTAYGRCTGLTRPGWTHGPRITLASSTFSRGHRCVDDVLVHEMLHVWLYQTGRSTEHNSAPWYEAIRRLSPAVLGRELDVRHGGDRRSVRLPNPHPDAGQGQPATVVRKVPVPSAVPHAAVATWPGAFRPADYDLGEPIDCPSY